MALIYRRKINYLQMTNNFCFPRQSPYQSSSIRGWIFLTRLHSYWLSIVIGPSLVNKRNQLLHKLVANLLTFPLVTLVHFKAVVKQYMCLPFIVIRINNSKVFLRESSRRVVSIDPVQRLQHLHHLFLALMPHSSAGVDSE